MGRETGVGGGGEGAGVVGESKGTESEGGCQATCTAPSLCLFLLFAHLFTITVL